MLSTCIWCYFEDASKFVHFLQIPGRDSSRKGNIRLKSSNVKCSIQSDQKSTLSPVVYFTTAPTVAYNMWSTANNAIFALLYFSISNLAAVVAGQSKSSISETNLWLVEIMFWTVQINLDICKLSNISPASSFNLSGRRTSPSPRTQRTKLWAANTPFMILGYYPKGSPDQYVLIIHSNVESGQKMIQFNIHSKLNLKYSINRMFVQYLVKNILFKNIEKNESKLCEFQTLRESL